MALADIPTPRQPRRLDSWKEVADYIGRDVRTATRWEAQGMPLHRVPGGKGTSVFAFTDEIDAWMAGGRQENEPPDAAPATPATIAAEGAIRSVLRPRRRAAAAVVAALLFTIAAAYIAMRGGSAPLDARTLRADVSPAGISLTDASGVSRMIHTFAPGMGVPVEVRAPQVGDVDGDGVPDVLAGVSFYQDSADRSFRSGELLNLSTSGEVRWRFAFDDVLTFGDGARDGPWALADWQSRRAGPDARFAVAAHDYTWWAAMVAVLDRDGRRLSTFVNPGWVESVLWVGDDRLAIGGFNSMRDEAMFALLDVNGAAGQAPGSEGTSFACASCPSTPPLFYATFARSELNRLTAGRFNRARVSLLNDRVTVTTIEIEGETTAATAIYEFDRSLRLLGATYAERYWDAHRRLELEGRIAHAREACPERDGPAAIHVWSDSDWRRVTPR